MEDVPTPEPNNPDFSSPAASTTTQTTTTAKSTTTTSSTRSLENSFYDPTLLFSYSAISSFIKSLCCPICKMPNLKVTPDYSEGFRNYLSVHCNTLFCVYTNSFTNFNPFIDINQIILTSIKSSGCKTNSFQRFLNMMNIGGFSRQDSGPRTVLLNSGSLSEKTNKICDKLIVKCEEIEEQLRNLHKKNQIILSFFFSHFIVIFVRK